MVTPPDEMLPPVGALLVKLTYVLATTWGEQLLPKIVAVTRVVPPTVTAPKSIGPVLP